MGRSPLVACVLAGPWRRILGAAMSRDQGWPDGLFRPVRYACSRISYRPPPALYRGLSRRTGGNPAGGGALSGLRDGDRGWGGSLPGGNRPGCVPRGNGAGATAANVYLVRSGPGWVLIDTAWPHRGHLIKAAAESAFGAGARPEAIVLTHIHPDHSGSALEPARLWDLPVYVHPGELVLAPGGYLPEYANPLDRWLIAPLLRLMPRRVVERSQSRSSLEGTARAFDPAAGVPGAGLAGGGGARPHTGPRRVLPRPRPGAAHR